MPGSSNPESNNLRFRSFESPQDDEFFHQLQSNSVAAFLNSNWHLLRPVTRDTTTAMRKAMKENSVLFAVICRKDQKANNNSQNTDIGILHLKSPPAWLAHTRTLELNIGFAETQDGKDNFVEAINWARKWAFDNNLVDRLEWKIPGWNCDLSIGAIYLESKKQGALVKHGVKYDEYCLVHKRIEK